MYDSCVYAGSAVVCGCLYDSGCVVHCTAVFACGLKVSWVLGQKGAPRCGSGLYTATECTRCRRGRCVAYFLRITLLADCLQAQSHGVPADGPNGVVQRWLCSIKTLRKLRMRLIRGYFCVRKLAYFCHLAYLAPYRSACVCLPCSACVQHEAPCNGMQQELLARLRMLPAHNAGCVGLQLARSNSGTAS